MNKELSIGKLISFVIFAVFAITAFSAVMGSWFIVKPSERAGVRRLGTVDSAQPYGPGIHFKTPFISTVDKIQVSLTNVSVPEFNVTTIDNQIITLDINISYTTPDSAVFHLLYSVGSAGHGDIHDNILPIVRDRVSRIFASQNTNNINANREALQVEITKSVTDHLRELFKVDVQALQIAKIQFSNAFNDSNAQAVLSKNVAVKEENNLKVIGFQAQQKVVEAEGLAKQKIAEATGLSKSIELEAQGRAKAKILEATAESEAKTLLGKGEAARLQAESTALGGADNYIAFLHARAQQQWKGAYPENMTVLGSNTPVLLGLPSAPAQYPAQAPAVKK